MDEPLVLSALDDLFVHQIPEPVRHVGTSDRNFYDRHYFNVHAARDDFFVILGLGQYPNLATQDAFFSVRRGGRQTTLRSSRRLGDRGDMGCGPLRVQVLEGLQRLRITLAPNDSGFEADLEFQGLHAPQLEPRQVQRRQGRVIHDVMRYCQSGRYAGWLRLGGRTWHADEVPLAGYRDRSWGIRAIGRPEPAGAEADGVARSGLFGTPDWRRLHMACRFDAFTVNIKLHEDPDGHRALEDAVRLWHDGRPPEPLGRPQWEITRWSADRRLVEAARIVFSRPGEPERVMQVRQLLPLYLEAGTGYGNRPILPWLHGQYRGELVTDVVGFDLDAADPQLAGPIDCLAEMHMDGEVGHGLFEYTLFGRTDGFAGPGHFNAHHAG
ncbi:MAG: hypothetical protein E6R00_02110 [Gammaproteobacteria bacterium]|nr:MAG: hypothetical protein E6R00_02110 [Gammaproteobacteria bacterium]